MTEVTFGFQMEPMRINATHPLLSLIAHGGIVTDGTENMVTFINEAGRWRIGPLIHKDDSGFVFDSFRDFQEGRPAERETRGVWRLKKKDRVKNGDG